MATDAAASATETWPAYTSRKDALNDGWFVSKRLRLVPAKMNAPQQYVANRIVLVNPTLSSHVLHLGSFSPMPKGDC